MITDQSNPEKANVYRFQIGDEHPSTSPACADKKRAKEHFSTTALQLSSHCEQTPKKIVSNS